MQGRSHRSYLEYQDVQGILLPKLIGSAAGVPLERWTISIDQGLSPDLFAIPPERVWRPEDMRRIVEEHAQGAPEPLRLRWKTFYQGPQPPGRAIEATQLTLDLVDAYARRKLEAAGVLTQEGPWRLEAYIDRYYQTAPPYPPPPWRQVEIVVVVWKEGGESSQWSERFVRRWPVELRPIVDDVLADEWTYDILTSLARGWPQVLGLQPGASRATPTTPGR